MQKLYEDDLQELILNDPRHNESYYDSLAHAGGYQSGLTKQWNDLVNEDIYNPINIYDRGWQSHMGSQMDLSAGDVSQLTYHGKPIKTNPHILDKAFKGEGLEEQSEHTIQSAFLDYLYKEKPELLLKRMDEGFSRLKEGDDWEEEAKLWNVDEEGYRLFIK